MQRNHTTDSEMAGAIMILFMLLYVLFTFIYFICFPEKKEKYNKRYREKRSWNYLD